MFSTTPLFLAMAIAGYAAEISPSYTLQEKAAAFQPQSETHAVKESKQDVNHHPVYRAEHPVQGRVRMEPVRPLASPIKNEVMLGDQAPPSTDINRADDFGILGNGYAPQVYSDIPYAPGYFYGTGAGSPHAYSDDMYGPDSYLMDPVAPSALDLVWSQVPYGRTIVSYVGSTILWVFNSIFVLSLGALLTVGVCSYTNLCTIAFHGIGPIHEEMRMLMSPERLEKISNAADFVKTAINKYQKIQKVTEDLPSTRKRRSILKF